MQYSICVLYCVIILLPKLKLAYVGQSQSLHSFLSPKNTTCTRALLPGHLIFLDVLLKRLLRPNGHDDNDNDDDNDDDDDIISIIVFYSVSFLLSFFLFFVSFLLIFPFFPIVMISIFVSIITIAYHDY